MYRHCSWSPLVTDWRRTERNNGQQRCTSAEDVHLPLFGSWIWRENLCPRPSLRPEMRQGAQECAPRVGYTTCSPLLVGKRTPTAMTRSWRQLGRVRGIFPRLDLKNFCCLCRDGTSRFSISCCNIMYKARMNLNINNCLTLSFINTPTVVLDAVKSRHYVDC